MAKLSNLDIECMMNDFNKGLDVTLSGEELEEMLYEIRDVRSNGHYDGMGLVYVKTDISGERLLNDKGEYIEY